MNQTLAKILYVAGVTTFCTFLACWAVLAHQENIQGASSRQAQTRMADEEFAKKAAQGSMAEVKLGQLAEEKAQSPEVKKFAKRMVEDHTKANDELKQAAMKDNINLPTDLDPRDEAKYEQLSKLSGPEFDKAYAKEMVKDHEKDIAEFRREATGGQKPDIKKFAGETLPTLQSHLREAREMQQATMRGGMEKSRKSPGRAARR